MSGENGRNWSHCSLISAQQNVKSDMISIVQFAPPEKVIEEPKTSQVACINDSYVWWCLCGCPAAMHISK